MFHRVDASLHPFGDVIKILGGVNFGQILQKSIEVSKFYTELLIDSLKLIICFLINAILIDSKIKAKCYRFLKKMVNDFDFSINSFIFFWIFDALKKYIIWIDFTYLFTDYITSSLMKCVTLEIFFAFKNLQ